jgi:hypothetical protein
MHLRFVVAVLPVLLCGCQTHLGAGPVHLFQVDSMAEVDVPAFSALCNRALANPVVVSGVELFENPAPFEGRPITLTGVYVLAEDRSELRIDRTRRVWLSGAYDASLRNQRVTATGIFTTRRTAPEHPAATLCGVTSLVIAR